MRDQQAPVELKQFTKLITARNSSMLHRCIVLSFNAIIKSYIFVRSEAMFP